MHNGIQARLQDAKRIYEQKSEAIRNRKVSPEVVANYLKDLANTNLNTVTSVRELLSDYEAAIGEVRKALQTDQEIPGILFTHDVAFVADLKRAAKERGVQIGERSVARSRSDARKPGACTTRHPWKAKDVSARLVELRQQLDRIRKESSTWDEGEYEEAAAGWAGNLSETWERIFSQEIIGPVLAEGGLEVRPMMVRTLALFSHQDYREFEGSYSRVSQWARRHDKSVAINYVAPDVDMLDKELQLVDSWFRRIKGYKA